MRLTVSLGHFMTAPSAISLDVRNLVALVAVFRERQHNIYKGGRDDDRLVVPNSTSLAA
jgi:hypothetical protein